MKLARHPPMRLMHRPTAHRSARRMYRSCLNLPVIGLCIGAWGVVALAVSGIASLF